MISQLLVQVSEWLLVVAACTVIIFGLLAFVYDIRAVSFRRRLRNQKGTSFHQAPHITILVYTRNNETTIEACLAGVARSNYRLYDIVVIDDQSTDTTRKVLRQYQRTHAIEPLYLYNSRRCTDRQRLLRHGYNRSFKGQIVLVVDGAGIISPTLLADAATVFANNPKIQAVRLNQDSLDVSSPAQLYYRFMQLSRNVVMKAISVFYIGRISALQSNTFYRDVNFKKDTSVFKIRYTYESSLSLKNVSFRDQQQAPITLSITVVFFMTYFMYVAATLQTSTLLLLSWLIVSSWLILVVWSDEMPSLRQKLILSFCIPAAYFLFFVYLALQIIFVGTKYVVIMTSPLVVTESELTNTAEHKL